MKSSWKVQLTLPILLLALAELSSSPAGGSQSFQPTPGDPMLEPWRWRVFPELNGLGVQCIGEGKAGTEAGEVLCFARRKPIAHSTGAPEESDGKWMLYDESDGLRLNPHPRILQLNDGSVWVISAGSPGWENRFDGKRWRSKPMQGTGAMEDCNSVLQTRDRVFWVGCNGSVAAEKDENMQEFDSLRQNIEHIKEIVAMQEEFPELAVFTLEFPTDEARETDDAGNGNDCECPATRQAAFAATVNEL